MSDIPPYAKYDKLRDTFFGSISEGWDPDGERSVRVLEFDQEFCLDADGEFDASRWDAIWNDAIGMVNFRHPNAVAILRAIKDQRWIVTEWIEKSVADAIRDSALGSDQVRTVLSQTLKLLVDLHQSEGVHSDIQPATLLYDKGGFVKLDYSPGLRLAGRFVERKMGTKYQAPELSNSDFGNVGPPVDLYSLGFTALEMLCGPEFEQHFPLGAGEPTPGKWLEWHGSPQTLDIAKIVPGVPADLAGVISKLTAKQVEERYASAAEALRALPTGVDTPIEIAPPKQATPEPSKEKSPPAEPLTESLQTSPLQESAVSATKVDSDEESSKVGWFNRLSSNPKVQYSVIFVCMVIVLMLLIPGGKGGKTGKTKVEIDSDPSGASFKVFQITEEDGTAQARQISVDDNETPATLELTHGTYRFDLTKGTDYEAFRSQLVDIAESSETLKLDTFKLVRVTRTQTRAVVVDSNPAGAKVEVYRVENESRRKLDMSDSTKAQLELEPGTYVFELSLPKYKTHVTDPIEIEPGEGPLALSPYPLVSAIKPKQFINVAVVPADARLFVDGSEIQLQQGPYRIELPDSGVTRTLRVSAPNHANKLVTIAGGDPIKREPLRILLNPLIAVTPNETEAVLNGSKLARNADGQFELPFAGKPDLKLLLKLKGESTQHQLDRKKLKELNYSLEFPRLAILLKAYARSPKDIRMGKEIRSLSFGSEGDTLGVVLQDSKSFYNLKAKPTILKGTPALVLSTTVTDPAPLVVAYHRTEPTYALGCLGSHVLLNREGQEQIVLQDHEGAVIAATFSNNGKTLVTADVMASVLIWSESGTKTGALQASNQVWGLAIDPTNKVLACGTMLSRLPDGAIIGELPAKTRSGGSDVVVRCADFSPSGKRLASGLNDGQVYVWNVPTRTIDQVIDAGERPIQGLAFLDEELMVTAGRDGKVQFWDMGSKPAKSVRTEMTNSEIMTLSFDPLSRRFAIGTKDGSIITFGATPKALPEPPAAPALQ